MDAAIRAWSVDYGDSDSDLSDLDMQRAMGYQLAKENPIAIGALGTQVTNVIGTGLQMQCNLDREYLERVYGITAEQADKWEIATESRWRSWAESLDCDLERQQNFYDLQGLMLRTELTAGDAFSVMPFVKRRDSNYGIKVQPIDPARVRNERDVPATRTLAGGIERDAQGAVRRYHFMNQHPWTRKVDGMNYSWNLVPAFGRATGRRNVVHMYQKTVSGVSSSRGKPIFAPLVKTLKQLSRYTDAELMAAVIQSFFTVFVTTEDGTGFQHGEVADPQTQNVANQGNEVALGMGNIVDLAAGEKIDLVKTERPNSGFDGFMTSMLRQVGMALNIPYEVLLKHFQSSYSASRAAMLEYWKSVKELRQHCANHFCKVVYANWLAESVASEQTEAPAFFTDPMARQAWSGTYWIGPPRGMIDPTKEVAAELDLLDATLKPRSDITMELLGKDWESSFARLTRENRLIAASGIDLQTPNRSKQVNLIPEPPENTPDQK